MTTRLTFHTARIAALCLLAATIGLPAVAATPKPAGCARVPAGDAHRNCLSEASTARAAGRPTAVGEDPAALARNAMRRCDGLPDADRSDCVARMHGMGTASGSVSGGGIYRELVTREIDAPAPMPAPAGAKQ